MTDTRLYYSTAANASSAVPPGLHQNAEKTTPVDADELPLADSTLGWSYRRLSWANLKLAVGVYYNSLTATMTNKTITAPTITTPKINYINDTNGAVALQFIASALQVEALEAETVEALEDEPAVDGAVDDKDAKIGSNYFAMYNSAVGVTPTIAVTGPTDTLVAMQFRTKGKGGYSFRVGGAGTQFVDLIPNTDASGDQGRLSITNAPLSAPGTTMTIAAHATGSGKTNASLNLTSENAGAVFANSVPVVTGAPSGLPLQPLSLWSGTKAQYDAIATKSANTIYVVTAATAVTGDITVDEGVETGDIAVEPPAPEVVADETAAEPKAAPATKSTRKK
jgi:hypothetical protein